MENSVYAEEPVSSPPPSTVSAVTLCALTPSFSCPLRKDAKLDAVLRLWRLRQENPCLPFETFLEAQSGLELLK